MSHYEVYFIIRCQDKNIITVMRIFSSGLIAFDNDRRAKLICCHLFAKKSRTSSDNKNSKK